jgi:hypothetical protein
VPAPNSEVGVGDAGILPASGGTPEGVRLENTVGKDEHQASMLGKALKHI